MTAEERKALEVAFIEGFRTAADKIAFLRLARVPLELADGGKLVEVRLQDRVEVGAVSPGFGSRALVYQPLPGRLAKEATALEFVYRTIDGDRGLTLGEVLSEEPATGASARGSQAPRGDERRGHGHEHPHREGDDRRRDHDHRQDRDSSHAIEALRVDPTWRAGRD
ncbi:MAG TPA: hypothetical protein VMF53_17305 [Alphaproteobacteria bacterium]|nr:hypothetical protein [Alphaproteobacteria bacterium]